MIIEENMKWNLNKKEKNMKYSRYFNNISKRNNIFSREDMMRMRIQELFDREDELKMIF